MLILLILRVIPQLNLQIKYCCQFPNAFVQKDFKFREDEANSHKHRLSLPLLANVDGTEHQQQPPFDRCVVTLGENRVEGVDLSQFLYRSRQLPPAFEHQKPLISGQSQRAALIQRRKNVQEVLVRTPEPFPVVQQQQPVVPRLVMMSVAVLDEEIENRTID